MQHKQRQLIEERRAAAANKVPIHDPKKRVHVTDSADLQELNSLSMMKKKQVTKISSILPLISFLFIGFQTICFILKSNQLNGDQSIELFDKLRGRYKQIEAANNKRAADERGAGNQPHKKPQQGDAPRRPQKPKPHEDDDVRTFSFFSSSDKQNK